MKKLNVTAVVTVLFAVFVLTGSVLAAEHGMSGMSHDGMAGMDHSKMNHEQMEGMMAGMMPLGHVTVDEVKATAQIKDVRAAMKEHGMTETHHVMVHFSGAANDVALSKGTVAVRIIAPSGKSTEPVMMMGMNGDFGSDITLAEKGKNTIEIACKLEDGKKRQFKFQYDVK